MKFRLRYLLPILLFCMVAVIANAQPSLDPSDQFFLTEKNEHNRDETFVIIRDGRPEKRDVFYIVPSTPRLEIRGTGKDALPVFHLLKYQYEDKKGDIIEGGILQFSVNFGVPQKTRADILKSIENKFDLKKAEIAPFPVTRSQIKFYSLEGKQLPTEEEIDEAASEEADAAGSESSASIGPAFGNQSIPFQVKLTDLTADLYDHLSKGTGGLPIIVSITYQGLTPRLGARITANFEKIYETLDTALTSGGSANCPIMEVGSQGEYGLSLAKMEETKMVNIEAFTGAGYSDQEHQTITETVLSKIYEEVFANDGMTFPTEIPKAEAAQLSQADTNPNPGAEIGEAISEVASGATALGKLAANLLAMTAKVNIGFQLKARHHVKKGNITFDLRKRSVVNRTCAFGTCLSIRDYVKDHKDDLITVVKVGGWAKTYFTLPFVSDLESLGIKYITLTVKPTLKGTSIANMGTKSATFKAGAEDWVDKNGEMVRRLAFPMAAIFKNLKSDEKFEFEVGVTIQLKRQELKFTRTIPLTNGDVPVSDPANFIDIVSIDGTMLDYVEKGEAGPVFVKATLTAKPLKGRTVTHSAMINFETSTADFVIPPDSETVDLQLTFKRGDGKMVKKTIKLKEKNGNLTKIFEIDNEMWLLPSEKLEEVVENPDELIYDDLVETEL